MKSHPVFRRCFLVLWLAGMVLLGVWLAVTARQSAQRQTEHLLDDALRSAQLTARMSHSARQIAVTFDPDATLALLDAEGHIVAQTREFLLVRAPSPQLALLDGLAEAQRGQLRDAAAGAPSSTGRLLACSAAYQTTSHGGVVYPYEESGRVESQPAAAPIQLALEPTGAEDVWQATLTGSGTEHALWLPYLRSEGSTPETSRLLELAQGAAPRQSLLRWEHFRTEPAPDGLGAATLAAYQCSHPLADTLRETGWGLPPLLLTSVCSAVIALAAEYLWKRRRAAAGR